MHDLKEAEYSAMRDYINALEKTMRQNNIQWDSELLEQARICGESIYEAEKRYWKRCEKSAILMNEKRHSGNPKYLRGKAKEKYLQEHPDFQ